MKKKWLALLLGLLLGAGPIVQAEGSRTLTMDDLFREKEVSDPQIAPGGDWVAYTVKTTDLKAEKSSSDLWMTNWEGTQRLQLTATPKDSESTPRWSPDGRYLAFLSGRGDEHEADQLWLLNRLGGEAQKITDLKGSVVDFVWSPNGKQLALVVEDPDPEATPQDSASEKTPKPIVIDRFRFKEDITGYLGKLRQHLYLFDVERRQAQLLTPGDYNEMLPAWSPDGKSLAFVSKRHPDFDRDDNWDIYVMPAIVGATPRAVTTFDGSDNEPTWGSYPAWSPDGKFIAYLQGGPQKLIYYAVHHLAVVPVAGGPARVLTQALDRNVQAPSWSTDGKSIQFLVEDDRAQVLARVPAAGGKVEQLVSGRRVISAYTAGPGGKAALLVSTAQTPAEVFAWNGGALRPLSRQNDDWLATIRLGAVEEISFPSKDGTLVHGFVVKPPNYQPGKKYPTLLRIHGGPVSQFDLNFDFSWQLFAAHGYVVVAANPRGSSGRGEEFTKAIYADWGNKDAQDVLAAVDYLVAQGIADPERLGVGGWSYGGMLTNYTIAQDPRFKAAVSGASISNILAGYGTDQYIHEYEQELGKPWENPQGWLKISFPFYHADRIVTPTLFLCGEKDFNVPLLNSEQMYQALKSLGRETQLIIYPGQFHGITKPSYLQDRLERYLSWYDKHLKPIERASVQ
ncbi:alpha/beta hydrolase family protein [Anthocerotibacter panamensis]|uniref:alpha/beta hydrolase family protein n=1 Tax=Anthocerotibacter panamensis TaxID=2857077 RepID=UPI001C403BEF|nr:S9 family peptidase [Anthocerotibacter panamensis]